MNLRNVNYDMYKNGVVQKTTTLHYFIKTNVQWTMFTDNIYGWNNLPSETTFREFQRHGWVEDQKVEKYSHSVRLQEQYWFVSRKCCWKTYNIHQTTFTILTSTHDVFDDYGFSSESLEQQDGATLHCAN